jgi:hypothetical protein
MNALLKKEAQLYRSILGIAQGTVSLFLTSFLAYWFTFTLGFTWKFGSNNC